MKLKGLGGRAGGFATLNENGKLPNDQMPAVIEEALPYGSAPAMDGTASAGESDDYARGDHVHPTDTSRAPLASPALTGTPTAPTQPTADNSTKLATTEFVKNAIGAARYGHVYGFHIDSSESDPSACVTYLADAVGATPAAMDYTNGRFEYGFWADAFFLPKPCMLKSDGTVDYYLDPDDYSKKYDGTASDVADDTYDGNAMMEWGQGGKKIWYKIVPDPDDNTSASVYIADYQVDEDYRAWSFINNQGILVDHFYTPIYNGSLDSNGKLRSISGKPYSALCQGKTSAQEVAAAELNNPSTDKLWYTEVYADVTIINLLLILMAKSLDMQTAFGTGRCGQSAAASSMLGTGTLDDKGQFFGYSANTGAVKVFGMENWWGNQWRRYAGHIMNSYVQKYKMTRGRQDGSTADDYIQSTTATDYNGYLTSATAPSTNGFVKAMEFNANGFMTKTVGGTSVDSAHYWCDYFYQNSGLRYALRGGACHVTDGPTGAFYVYLSGIPDYTYWAAGAAPSCKPLSPV